MRKQINNLVFFFSCFLLCLLFADVCDLMWFPLKSSSFYAAPGSLPAGGLRSPRCITLTRLRLVRSRTQTHSANCRLVLHTPDRNHRQDDCGFNGQRKQSGPQKQMYTPRCCHKYTRLTSVEQNKQKRSLTHLGLKPRLVSLNKFFFFFLSKLESVKWWKNQNGGPG